MAKWWRVVVMPFGVLEQPMLDESRARELLRKTRVKHPVAHLETSSDYYNGWRKAKSQ